MKWNKIQRLFIIPFVLLFLYKNLFAQALSPEGMETNTYRNLKLYTCFNFVDISGSKQVAEYEYPHDSVTIDGEIRLIYLPQRMHLELSIKNEKDHYIDISYAYKDILLFRGKNNTMFHNLENIRLLDLDTSTSSPGIDVSDYGKDYGIQTSLGNFLLRLKTPDFPFHLYVDSSLIKKDGVQQQRFMSGSAYFNEQVRASRDREINWTTEDIVVGTNGHIGPVEIEFLHGEKRFYANDDDILYDSYNSAGFDTVLRNAGVYPHNIIPDQKGSYNTFKLHTSYTGRLVASATLSNIKRENLYSEASADYLLGYAEVTWIPFEKLTFFFNYRYMDRDVDNPDTVTISNLSNPLNTYTYDVKPSISSISNKFSSTVRYRVFNGLTLKLKYSRDSIQRKEFEEWDLPEKTVRNEITTSADTRLRRNLALKVDYTYNFTDNPSTNIEPDSSNEGKVSLTWQPIKWMSTLLSYSIKDGDRKELNFLDIQADNRHIRQHGFHNSITLLPLKDISLTVSYFLLSDRITQDIEYHDTTGIPHIENRVPYKNTSHNYSADITYNPVERMVLNIGFNHTKSEGMFSSDDINLTEPVSIASFSELKTEGTVYYISGSYNLGKNLSSGFHYRYSIIEDLLDNPHDDIEDGKAHILILTFSKQW